MPPADRGRSKVPACTLDLIPSECLIITPCWPAPASSDRPLSAGYHPLQVCARELNPDGNCPAYMVPASVYSLPATLAASHSPANGSGPCAFTWSTAPSTPTLDSVAPRSAGFNNSLELRGSTVEELALGVPQLGSSTLSGRAWRPRASRRSQWEFPTSGNFQPRPQLLERAASNVAGSLAFDHPGAARASCRAACKPWSARTRAASRGAARRLWRPTPTARPRGGTKGASARARWRQRCSRAVAVPSAAPR